MPKASLIVRKAAVRPDLVVDTVTLDHAARNRAHAHLTTAGGLSVDLALDRAAGLEDGDALKLEDGRLVGVRAAEEALLEVRAGNPARLLRLAWQLGGEHVPAEVGAEVLYVPARAAELVRGAGCAASPVNRPFKPEKAAHDHSQCGHDHHHHDDHEAHAHHDHGHGPVHSHDHGHGHDHAHGSCGHDHSHEHDHGHKHAHEHNHEHNHEHGHGHDHEHGHGHGHGHAHKH
ncbi:urease accessory protein UreE [Methylorubrum populi]|uniref:urease accessory protein UreE n=1 Tax=Methylorubrum populi TaxID=223967 RepID=UPI000BBA58F4|nr:urease accessory protein UreE [Methylorubrum populi]